MFRDVFLVGFKMVQARWGSCHNKCIITEAASPPAAESNSSKEEQRHQLHNFHSNKTHNGSSGIMFAAHGLGRWGTDFRTVRAFCRTVESP